MLEWIEEFSQSASELITGLLEGPADVLADYVWGWPQPVPLLVVVLLGTGLFVTIRMGLIQIRGFKHAIDITRGKYGDPEDEGDLAHFQALTTALSATVGIGNIAGVAIAIRLGGPGALLWMWLTAFFGMALKFCECTLALKFRKVHADGSVSGGPMYYIEKGLGPKFKWMAVAFAAFTVICSFGTGNMNQSNTMSDAMQSSFGVHPVWTGLIAAFLVGLVIIGGIRRIGRVTSILAPGMALLYVGGALVILSIFAAEIPGAFVLIVDQAFSPDALVGGGAGSFLLTLMWGIRRGLFSNEAGQGSAPIAHATAKTKEPVREGLVASLGPFIDTLVICTMTGLVILVSGVWKEKVDQSWPLDAIEGVAVLDAGAPAPTDRDLLRLREERQGNGGDLVVMVEGGVPQGSFATLDALLEEPRLVDLSGKPWSGTLTVAVDGSLSSQPDDQPVLQARGLLTGAPLTSRAFQKGLPGRWGDLIVTLAVLLFAVSTGIPWSYYGDRGTEYLFGAKAIPIYRWVYVFFFFMGAILPLQAVWTFGDVALGLMSFPNLIAVILLSGVVARLSKDYFSREHKRIDR